MCSNVIDLIKLQRTIQQLKITWFVNAQVLVSALCMLVQVVILILLNLYK